MLSPKVHEHAELEASPQLPQIQPHKWVHKLNNLFTCGGINIFCSLQSKPVINSQVSKLQEQCQQQTYQLERQHNFLSSWCATAWCSE